MKSWRTRLLVPVAAVLGALPLVAGVATAPGAAAAEVLVPAVPAGVQEQQVLDGVNAERARTGAGPVVLDPVLDRVAQDWADRLGQGDGMRHNPDLPRLLSGFPRWGEVVATADKPTPDTRGTMDGAMAVRAWLGSPPHRAVLQDRSLTSVGIGLVHTATTSGGRTVWRTYWVADFGGGRTGFVQDLPGGDRAVAGIPVRGALLQRYAASGAQDGYLGVPVGREFGPLVGGGWGQHFAGGSLYWQAGTGAHAVRGALRERWASLGWERSGLGYPTAEEVALPGGGYGQWFQGGLEVWGPGTGAGAVRGAILDRWGATGWVEGSLGYPTSSDTVLRGGASTHFQRGSIFWSPSTGARVVPAAVRDAFAAQGWEAGRLGYPTGEARTTARGLVQDFQGGRVDVVDGRASTTFAG